MIGINRRDYGVVGDGEHDDTEGIQRLIDRYGLEVLNLLKPGQVYKVKEPIHDR